MYPQGCPQGPGFRPCEGWAPGSSTNPTQQAGGFGFRRFPRDVGHNATVRPLDDYSNTYIGLHVVDPSVGSGHYKCKASHLLSLDAGEYSFSVAIYSLACVELGC